MFELTKQETKENRLIRTYTDGTTNTVLTTTLLRTDKAGRKWWTFEDMFAIPFIRQLAAKKIIDLYGHGIIVDDIYAFTGEMKVLLRAKDEGEKYERIYAKVLEMEQLTKIMADPVQQSIGLSTVYLLMDDERPDVYVMSEQQVKMTAMSVDLDNHAFFLDWWTGIIARCGGILKAISAIASTLERR